MAAIFKKKGPTPEHTVLPSAIYTDLYDNNQTTADIQSGTVSEITKTNVFLADYLLPSSPSYGGGELIGAETAFYINSMTVGDGTNSSTLKAYLLKKEIGDREGGKSSGTGSLISNEDIFQIAAFHDESYSSIVEEFSGEGAKGLNIAFGNTFVAGNKAYLTKADGYDYGERFGGKNNTGYNKMGKDSHFKQFGESSAQLGDIYRIHRDQYNGASVYMNYWWWSDKDRKTFTGTYHEKYTPYKMESKVQTTSGSGPTIDPDSARQGNAGTSYQSLGNSTEYDRLTTYNSIFDIVHSDRSFVSLNGDSIVTAFARPQLSTAKVLNGNKSLHMEAVYPHRFNMSTNIHYPMRGNQDGSQNQQCTFVSTILPLPIHLYSREPNTDGSKQPVMPTIELDVNFDELAPMLIRDQNSLYAEPAHDYRLTRSITITFGEEEPNRGENLFNYVKAHAPSAASDGDGTGTGDGSNAKSFYGVSFVKHNGQISYYNLGNAGKSGSTYTDTTFVLDNSRGEVCFQDAPTAAEQGDFSSSWFTLAFQTHPNDQGAYWAMFDPTDGNMISAETPYTTTRLTNLKNITDSSSGVWADNLTYWPKYMTIWVSNCAAVKGTYNKSAKRYETGLQTSGAGSGSTTLKVIEASGVGNVSGELAGVTVTGAGKLNESYLLLDRGSDITIADADGTNASSTVVTENNNAQDSNTFASTYTITSDSWSDGQTVFHNSNVDSQITTSLFDCRNSFFIDAIRLKCFNIIHENATPHKGSTKYGGRLRMPTTAKLPNTAWQDGSSTVANAFDNKTQQPSYMLLGFNNLTDISTAEYNGEIKLLHFNGYQTGNAQITGNIVTNDDSDLSNIRVGFTSSVEKLGRQGAADSTAGSHPDFGNGESPCFSNGGTSPTYYNRGLVVGDLDVAGKEFSVESDGSGTDGVGNVDYFTQKGLVKFIAGHNSFARFADSTSNVAKADSSALGAGEGSVKVTDADDFVVDGFIRIGNEIMQVTNVNSGTDVITITRGIGATDALEHAHNSDIHLLAIPQKRECIFASARILDTKGSRGLVVDSPQLFEAKQGEEYIIYEYNAAHSDLDSYVTMRIVDKNDNEITFDRQHNINYANKHKYLISPKRYWLMVEVMNVAGAHSWQDDSSSTLYLPEKSYTNCVQISEKGTYGATYNESLYTDGAYDNSWSLEIYDPEDNTTIAKLDDFGLGAFDEEKKDGGFCSLLPLTINDVNKYVYMDLNDVIKKESKTHGDTVPILLTTGNPDNDVKFNIDTEIGTNKIFLRGIYEDKLPSVTDFNIQPNEENPYNVDFTWQCGDTDLWYGFLIVDDTLVPSQYHGAVLYYPMNEVGAEGAKATAPVDQIQGMTTSVDGTSSTGPFYDPYGLAGFCLRNDDTNTPEIAIGTGSADPLQTTGHTVTDEMSLSIHVKHDAETDGVLADYEYLIYSEAKFLVQINTDCTVSYRQYWDTNSYVELQSAGKVATDGDTPTHIMVTFDANLTSGNLKLFIDGKLEDQSGEVILADSGAANDGWLYSANLESNNNKIFVGNTHATGSKEFLGTMEEFVIYNKCLYPVDVKSGKFTLTKPLSEVADSSAYTTSKSYSARLFVKDYHNIRGTTSEEVACSSNLSFRKAAFRFNNS